MGASRCRRVGLVPSAATGLIAGGFLGDGLISDLQPLVFPTTPEPRLPDSRALGLRGLPRVAASVPFPRPLQRRSGTTGWPLTS